MLLKTLLIPNVERLCILGRNGANRVSVPLHPCSIPTVPVLLQVLSSVRVSWPVTLRVLTGVRASSVRSGPVLRTQISARLSEMDAQLLRLQSIADHIDREFANTRLVSRAEKLHSNFGLKYDLYWNLKGMISVKAFVFSWGHKRAHRAKYH